LGLILDTSVIIAGERRNHSVPEILRQARATWGDTEMGLSAVTIAELTHGIQRARLEVQRARQQAFVDEVMAILKVHAISAAIAPQLRPKTFVTSRESRASLCDMH
jgi:tRNA(fMet)-specific endonuclease VapC